MAESERDKSGGGSAEVRYNIQDGTSSEGMSDRARSILEALRGPAARAGLSYIDVVAGKGGGHKSHSGGTEWDIKGFNRDGSLWSVEQRVAVAAAARDAGSNRIGLYDMENGVGKGTLHIGYSGKGRPRAMWGADGLTEGPASRKYSNPAELAFYQSFEKGDESFLDKALALVGDVGQQALFALTGASAPDSSPIWADDGPRAPRPRPDVEGTALAMMAPDMLGVGTPGSATPPLDPGDPRFAFEELSPAKVSFEPVAEIGPHRIMAPAGTPPEVVAELITKQSPPEVIQALQQNLADSGFNPGPIDGVMGGQTRRAVQEFQRANGLPDDGKPGPMTLGALQSPEVQQGGFGRPPQARPDAPPLGPVGMLPGPQAAPTGPAMGEAPEMRMNFEELRSSGPRYEPLSSAPPMAMNAEPLYSPKHDPLAGEGRDVAPPQMTLDEFNRAQAEQQGVNLNTPASRAPPPPVDVGGLVLNPSQSARYGKDDDNGPPPMAEPGRLPPIDTSWGGHFTQRNPQLETMGGVPRNPTPPSAPEDYSQSALFEEAERNAEPQRHFEAEKERIQQEANRKAPYGVYQPEERRDAEAEREARRLGAYEGLNPPSELPDDLVVSSSTYGPPPTQAPLTTDPTHTGPYGPASSLSPWEPRQINVLDPPDVIGGPPPDMAPIRAPTKSIVGGPLNYSTIGAFDPNLPSGWGKPVVNTGAPPPMAEEEQQQAPNFLQEALQYGKKAVQAVTPDFIENAGSKVGSYITDKVKERYFSDPIDRAFEGALDRDAGKFDNGKFWGSLDNEPSMKNEVRQAVAARRAAEGNALFGSGSSPAPSMAMTRDSSKSGQGGESNRSYSSYYNSTTPGSGSYNRGRDLTNRTGNA